MRTPFTFSSVSEPATLSVRLRVLSLGAGVQSTTLALMATHGQVGPMPDCAIFADTGWVSVPIGYSPERAAENSPG